MRSTIVWLLATVVLYTSAIPRRHDSSIELEKRQMLNFLTDIMGKGGKTSAPPGSAPTRQELQPVPDVPGAKRVKMRYGPYSVIGMQSTSLTGENGALWNYPDTSVPKPADGDFTIFGMQAGLEYPNGTDANIDTGMWLHHMVHITRGPGRADPTCAGRGSLPHLDVGASPDNSERSFSSGNERTALQLGGSGRAVDAGYPVTSADSFALIVDLMNMNADARTVFVTMTYDFAPGFPAGWDAVKPVWFDADDCGTSEVKPPQQAGAFAIRSKPWPPNFEGQLLGVGGHVHDGGVDVEIWASPDARACDSVATYGGDPRYVAPASLAMGGSMGFAKNHISAMSQCSAETSGVKNITKGQQWFVKANYDYEKYPGNKDADGKQADIMAIAIMYVRVPRAGVKLDLPPNASSSGASMLSSIWDMFSARSGIGGVVSRVLRFRRLGPHAR